MPSVTAAVNDFIHAITAIFGGLFNSVLAVFHAIFALGTDILGAFAQIGQSLVKLGFDVFQGAFGFVAANFFILLIAGGGYYLYTNSQRANTRKTVKTN